MRRHAWTIVLAAAAAAAPPATAPPATAADRSGIVKSFHGPHRVLVLDDGSQYHVPESVAVPPFRSGAKARFTTERRGGRDVITRLDVAE